MADYDDGRQEYVPGNRVGRPVQRPLSALASNRAAVPLVKAQAFANGAPNNTRRIQSASQFRNRQAAGTTLPPPTAAWAEQSASPRAMYGLGGQGLAAGAPGLFPGVELPPPIQRPDFRTLPSKERESMEDEIRKLRGTVTGLREQNKVLRTERQRLEEDLGRARNTLVKAEELLNAREKALSPTMGLTQMYRTPETTALVAKLKEQVKTLRAEKERFKGDLEQLLKSTKATRVAEVQAEAYACFQELARQQEMTAIMKSRMEVAEAHAAAAERKAKAAEALAREFTEQGSSLPPPPLRLAPGNTLAAGRVQKTMIALQQAHRVLLSQAALLKAVFPPGLRMEEFAARAAQKPVQAGGPEVLRYLRHHVKQMDFEMLGLPGDRGLREESSLAGLAAAASPTSPKTAKPARTTPRSASRQPSSSGVAPSAAPAPAAANNAASPAESSGPKVEEPTSDPRVLLLGIADLVRELRAMDADSFMARPELEADVEQLSSVAALLIAEHKRLTGTALQSAGSNIEDVRENPLYQHQPRVDDLELVPDGEEEQEEEPAPTEAMAAAVKAAVENVAAAAAEAVKEAVAKAAADAAEATRAAIAKETPPPVVKEAEEEPQPEASQAVQEEENDYAEDDFEPSDDDDEPATVAGSVEPAPYEPHLGPNEERPKPPSELAPVVEPEVAEEETLPVTEAEPLEEPHAALPAGQKAEEEQEGGEQKQQHDDDEEEKDLLDSLKSPPAPLDESSSRRSRASSTNSAPDTPVQPDASSTPTTRRTSLVGGAWPRFKTGEPSDNNTATASSAGADATAKSAVPSPTSVVDAAAAVLALGSHREEDPKEEAPTSVTEEASNPQVVPTTEPSYTNSAYDIHNFNGLGELSHDYDLPPLIYRTEPVPAPPDANEHVDKAAKDDDEDGTASVFADSVVTGSVATSAAVPAVITAAGPAAEEASADAAPASGHASKAVSPQHKEEQKVVEEEEEGVAEEDDNQEAYSAVTREASEPESTRKPLPAAEEEQEEEEEKEAVVDDDDVDEEGLLQYATVPLGTASDEEEPQTATAHAGGDGKPSADGQDAASTKSEQQPEEEAAGAASELGEDDELTLASKAVLDMKEEEDDEGQKPEEVEDVKEEELKGAEIEEEAEEKQLSEKAASVDGEVEDGRASESKHPVADESKSESAAEEQLEEEEAATGAAEPAGPEAAADEKGSVEEPDEAPTHAAKEVAGVSAEEEEPATTAAGVAPAAEEELESVDEKPHSKPESVTGDAAPVEVEMAAPSDDQASGSAPASVKGDAPAASEDDGRSAAPQEEEPVEAEEPPAASPVGSLKPEDGDASSVAASTPASDAGGAAPWDVQPSSHSSTSAGAEAAEPEAKTPAPAAAAAVEHAEHETSEGNADVASAVGSDQAESEAVVTEEPASVAVTPKPAAPAVADEEAQSEHKSESVWTPEPPLPVAVDYGSESPVTPEVDGREQDRAASTPASPEPAASERSFPARLQVAATSSPSDVTKEPFSESGLTPAGAPAAESPASPHAPEDWFERPSAASAGDAESVHPPASEGRTESQMAPGSALATPMQAPSPREQSVTGYSPLATPMQAPSPREQSATGYSPLATPMQAPSPREQSATGYSPLATPMQAPSPREQSATGYSPLATPMQAPSPREQSATGYSPLATPMQAPSPREQSATGYSPLATPMQAPSPREQSATGYSPLATPMQAPSPREQSVTGYSPLATPMQAPSPREQSVSGQHAEDAPVQQAGDSPKASPAASQHGAAAGSEAADEPEPAHAAAEPEPAEPKSGISAEFGAEAEPPKHAAAETDPAEQRHGEGAEAEPAAYPEPAAEKSLSLEDVESAEAASGPHAVPSADEEGEQQAERSSRPQSVHEPDVGQAKEAEEAQEPGSEPEAKSDELDELLSAAAEHAGHAPEQQSGEQEEAEASKAPSSFAAAEPEQEEQEEVANKSDRAWSPEPDAEAEPADAGEEVLDFSEFADEADEARDEASKPESEEPAASEAAASEAPAAEDQEDDEGPIYVTDPEFEAAREKAAQEQEEQEAASQQPEPDSVEQVQDWFVGQEEEAALPGSDNGAGEPERASPAPSAAKSAGKGLDLAGESETSQKAPESSNPDDAISPFMADVVTEIQPMSAGK
ncbi:hypothetical protein Agub_g9522 [Astrephomene gubernaculifera]|uniref:Uncharacterized protein n=1 Tax=Astrephomene gubernaculifera TaxID=47775 RepID=A0AAD3DW41_9CHLO|nr:hypothetical protein Agub_g9522 [Astrephomene gubernaculifera]